MTRAGTGSRAPGEGLVHRGRSKTGDQGGCRWRYFSNGKAGRKNASRIKSKVTDLQRAKSSSWTGKFEERGKLRIPTVSEEEEK